MGRGDGRIRTPDSVRIRVWTPVSSRRCTYSTFNPRPLGLHPRVSHTRTQHASGVGRVESIKGGSHHPIGAPVSRWAREESQVRHVPSGSLNIFDFEIVFVVNFGLSLDSLGRSLGLLRGSSLLLGAVSLQLVQAFLLCLVSCA